MPRIRETVWKLAALTFAFGLCSTLFCLWKSEAIIYLFLKIFNLLCKLTQKNGSK